MRGIMLSLIFVTLSSMASPGQSSSQSATSQASKKGPEIVRLTISPAKEPRPALKYTLLPGLMEQTPGDGMSLYYTIMDQLYRASQDEDVQTKISAWQETPPNRMDWKQLRDTVDGFGQLDDLDIAARFKLCEWNLPVEKRGISTFLPSLSRWRMAGKLLSARARLAVHESRFDNAAYTMRTGFAMARHVADGPTLIQGLVGVAIADLMLQPIQDLVQTPNSPNMYWALAGLPRPFADLREGIQGEITMFYGTFPELKKGMQDKLTDEEWNHLLREVVQTVSSVSGASDHASREQTIIQPFEIYGKAKDYFRSQGYSPEQISAMPVGKAVLLYSARQYEDLRDDVMKWWMLPYWQGSVGIQQADERIDKTKRGLLFGELSVTLAKVYAQRAALDLHIAVLQTIEAIRMHAAQTGRLPASLTDITVVPVPINPVTGQPFSYRLEGDTGILEGPAPSLLQNAVDTEYWLTLRK